MTIQERELRLLVRFSSVSFELWLNRA